MKNTNNSYEIKMDGEFHKFEGGAVRYTKTGKGRFDLIPKEVIRKIIFDSSELFEQCRCVNTIDDVIVESFEENYVAAIMTIVNILYVDEGDKIMTERGRGLGNDCHEAKSFDCFLKGFAKMLRDLAIHYEKGAEKYEEDNWKRGIPEQSFRDSGLRHMCQWLSGETDEPHAIAAIWNFFGAIYVSLNNNKETETTKSSPKDSNTDDDKNSDITTDHHPYKHSELFNNINKMIYDDYFRGCNITTESISDIGYEYKNHSNRNLFKLIESDEFIVLHVLKDFRFSSGFIITIKNKLIYKRVNHFMNNLNMSIPINEDYEKFVNRIILKIKGIIDKGE